MTEQIVVAATRAEHDDAAGLIRQYREWLRARGADRHGMIDAVAGTGRSTPS